MVGVAEDVAEGRGLDGVWLTAREELPEKLSSGSAAATSRWPAAARIELAKTLWLARPLPTADDTRAFGERLAGLVGPATWWCSPASSGRARPRWRRASAPGLRVRGDVTSPTFVISRVHPSLVGGPELVHVDAYRLGGAAELDDLDLDASLADSVTVVEWGAGIAERLAESWLDVRLDLLAAGGAAALAAAGPGRQVPPTTSRPGWRASAPSAPAGPPPGCAPPSSPDRPARSGFPRSRGKPGLTPCCDTGEPWVTRLMPPGSPPR